MEYRSNKISQIDDQIDLRYFLNLFFRKKIAILIISFLSLIASQIYIKRYNKVWEGEFQIVLDTKNTQTKSLLDVANLSGLNLIGNNRSKSSLSTQVGILKSPSVLMPVFEYVNSERKKINPDLPDIIFKSWLKGNLKIKLQDDTSILNISYKDTDKKIVLPVLSKISNAYQDYSGRSKKRKFELSKDYLNNQIEFYKNKSKKSIKTAQEYAMDQDLTLIGANSGQDMNIADFNISKILNSGQVNNVPNLNSNSLIKNIDIENVRVNAANKIRNIDIQINKINNIKDEEQLTPYLNSIFKQKDSGLTEQLNKVNSDLIKLRSKYTTKNNQIKQLEDLRDILIKEQKIVLINALKAQRIAAESMLEAAVRPKGVIIKYKELIREADRDENILVALENELRKLKLDESRVEDPWELITKPTLKIDPVEPKPLKIRFLGIFFSIIISYLFFWIREVKSRKIFDNFVLERILNTRVLTNLNTLDNDNLILENNFLEELFSLKNNYKIRFLTTDPIKNGIVSKFKKFFPPRDNFVFDNNLSSVIDDEIIILLSSLSDTTFPEIENLKKRIESANTKLYGIILIE